MGLFLVLSLMFASAVVSAVTCADKDAICSGAGLVFSCNDYIGGWGRDCTCGEPIFQEDGEFYWRSVWSGSCRISWAI
ncbi:MAG: hypothetical protein KKA43_00760 [Nanoarchaeota archaeon]|nr:hypothetical protein [Nanoarchaeota archaeon]